MGDELKMLYVIVGPTASGKTALGIEMAKELNGFVVSADSRQAYIGMGIGTAKPHFDSTLKERGNTLVQTPMTNAQCPMPHDFNVPNHVNGVPHFLFDIRRPDGPLTLSDWQRAAFEVIDSVDGTPLLVGGTMLYVDSVVFNYDLPQVEPDESLRKELEARAVEELYAELKEKDPSAVEFIEPKNKRRIVRALEVIVATGRPFSQARRQRPAKYDVKMMGLFPGWDELRARIERRVNEMLNEGLLEEMENLRKQYGKDLPLLKTMNYLQAGKVLDGEMSREETEEEMVRVNMRYAHRQMSWWKGRKEIEWFGSLKEALFQVQL